MSTSLTDAIYQFIFSAATIGLIAGFLVWLWRRYYRWRTFVTQGKGKVFVREPLSLGRRFLGRTEELAALENAVADNTPAVIVGTAGVGKTTLGLALADRLRKWGCRLVWLSCTEDTNLEAILDALSLHLKNRYHENGLREAFEKTQAHDAIQWIDLLADCLHGSRYVLLLDDLYLVEDRIVTSELLPRLFVCADVIIMTREITDELQTALRSSAKASIVQLRGLSEADALKLLQDLGLAGEHQELLLRFVRRVDGHPKALEIGAGLVKDKTHGLTLEQLLSQSIVGQDPQQPLMRMIRVSDKRLSGRERTLMVASSTFYESFCIEEIQAIHSHPQFAATLQDLVNRSLLDRDPVEINRYSLHPLVREFYQMLGNRMLWTKWGAFVVPMPFDLAVYHLPFRRWRLSRLLHVRAARYYQENRKDSPESESLVSQHFRRSGWWRAAAEAEGVILEVHGHPLAIIRDLWSLLISIGLVWAFAYMALPLLIRAGWSWMRWLDANKSPLVMLVISVGTAGWLLLETRMLRQTVILVTRKSNLLVCQHKWFLPRLRDPRSVMLGPGVSMWWFDRAFVDHQTLTMKLAWHVLNNRRFGYIVAHSKVPSDHELGLRFGPIPESGQCLVDLYKALSVDMPSAGTE